MSDASKIAGPTVGSRVKYSTKFIRSIGSVGNWRAEVVGTVIGSNAYLELEPRDSLIAASNTGGHHG